MRVERCIIGCGLAVMFCAVMAPPAHSQVVINELVINERDYSNDLPDTREFVELYNAGNTSVNLQDWDLRIWDLVNNNERFVDVLPDFELAPGGYFVMGHAGVDNVDHTLPAGDLWADARALVLELRNPQDQTQDAVAFEVYRTGTNRLANATPDQLAQIGNGYQARLFSFNNAAPNVQTSWGRYRDGVDTNRNGFDFGHLPLTPGASNNLPVIDDYRVPNVDGESIESTVDSFQASFIMPRVIDPTVVSQHNPRAIPASPQGGNAIAQWDPLGGGNTIYTKHLVNSFDIYAYIDTSALAIPLNGEQYEQSVYGIGTTDGRFAIADPLNNVSGQDLTENASSGLGWFYEQYQNGGTTSSKLMLVDFGEGGNSNPADSDWDIKQTIDVSGMESGWYRLAIDYDPETGEVNARFGDNKYQFTTDTDMFGTFYVGWRETIGSQGNHLHLLNPPIFDFVPETGDYDGDGDIDVDDYTRWKETYGTTVAVKGSGADGNEDGVIDARDYVVWRNQFEQASGLGLAALTTVPEPSAVAAWMLAAAAAIAVRRRLN